MDVAFVVTGKDMERNGFKLTAWLVLLFFMISSVRPVYAQGVFLPPPGEAVAFSKPYVPCLMTGVRFYPQDLFRFDFIVDPGDTGLSGPSLKDESTKLVKYFLATLTTPANDLWVNLSPFEGERVIPEFFGLTEMGRDLLAQDYLLKQLSSSLLGPDTILGKAFWSRVYAKAGELYGSAGVDVPVDTFNKVWIMPDVADIVVKNGTAVIVKSHMKLMLEADYVAMKAGEGANGATTGNNAISTEIMREVILPELEKEVNEGKNFILVRQVYSALILATWLKRKIIRDGAGLSAYVDGNKVVGVDHGETGIAEQIWRKYVAAFKKGTVDLIREERDQFSGEMIPHKYFSGGVVLSTVNPAEVTGDVPVKEGEFVCPVVILPITKDVAEPRQSGRLAADQTPEVMLRVKERLQAQRQKAEGIFRAYKQGKAVLHEDGIKEAGKKELKDFLELSTHHFELSRNGTQSQVLEGVFGTSRVLIKEVKSDEGWARYTRWENLLGAEELDDGEVLPLVAEYVTLENVMVHVSGEAVPRILKRVVVQSKVTPLLDTIQEIKKRYYNDIDGRQRAINGVLERFLDLFVRLLQRGVVGNPHGFLVDFGVTAQGQVVVMDVGDMAGPEDAERRAMLKYDFLAAMESTAIFAEMVDGQKMARIVDTREMIDARKGGFVQTDVGAVWDSDANVLGQGADAQEQYAPANYEALKQVGTRLSPEQIDALLEGAGKSSGHDLRRVIYQGPEEVHSRISTVQRRFIEKFVRDEDPSQMQQHESGNRHRVDDLMEDNTMALVRLFQERLKALGLSVPSLGDRMVVGPNRMEMFFAKNGLGNNMQTVYGVEADLKQIERLKAGNGIPAGTVMIEQNIADPKAVEALKKNVPEKTVSFLWMSALEWAGSSPGKDHVSSGLAKGMVGLITTFLKPGGVAVMVNTADKTIVDELMKQEGFMVFTDPDNRMVIVKSKDPTPAVEVQQGGVDFNPDQLKLNEDAASVDQLAYQFQGILPDVGDVLGYRPVILSIAPIADLRAFVNKGAQ